MATSVPLNESDEVFGGFMKSTINGYRLLAVTACGLIAAGCDSIRDVRSEPATSPPGHTGVLSGTITGLAPVRGLVLNAGITTVEGYNSERVFFGALNPDSQPIPVPFSYAAVPVGTPYNFTIVEEPYGKNCSIANPSGSVGDGGAAPEITCEDDPSTFRYPIGGTVNPALASLPEFAVTLTATRDYGVERIKLNGATSFEFESRGLNPTVSPSATVAEQQLFQWTITASYVEDGIEYQCRVVRSAIDSTPSNTGTSSAVNRRDVTGSAPVGSAGIIRHVQDCVFPIEANVKYSAPPGGTDQPMGAGGVTLALRQIADAVPPADAEPVTLTDFTPGTDRVVLWNLPSYPGAAYDLVVAKQPEGQTCIVRVINESVAGGTGGLGRNATSTGSLIWLSDPLVTTRFTPNDRNVENGVSIRCRDNPTPEKQLAGVFRNINENTFEEEPFIRIRDRQFLTFFEDGTFLYGSNGVAVRGSQGRRGLEHGFYDYDPVARTLDFNLFLDASTEAGTTDVQPASLSNTLGYGTIPAMSPPRLGANAISAPNGGVARATNVTFGGGTPAGISMTFSGTPINSTLTGDGAGDPVEDAVATSMTWTFTEPDQVPGTMTGSWIPDDHRRVWVFDFDNYSGFHAGVNGSINVQDGCFVFGDPMASSSYYTRRGGSTGCMTSTGQSTGGRGQRFFEYYESGFAGIIFSAPGGEPPGFFGKFPGAESARDGRPPSPNMFTITPGTPDTLTVQRMVNGEPHLEPAIFKRAQIKLD